MLHRKVMFPIVSRDFSQREKMREKCVKKKRQSLFMLSVDKKGKLKRKLNVQSLEGQCFKEIVQRESLEVEEEEREIRTVINMHN